MTYVQSGALMTAIQRSDWILARPDLIFCLCNATKECALASSRLLTHEAPVADLLATLTVYELSGPQDRRAAPPFAGPSRHRPWLTRWREWTCAPTIGPARRAGRLATRHAARQRKGTEMKAIARFLDWLHSGFAEGERMRREAYLAQAIDHCDLEYRIRELEREPSRVRDWW